MTRSRAAARISSGAVGAVRVALGILWLLEGILKYRAEFGAADIELVVESAVGNSRVPGYFGWFADAVMEPLRGLFGVAIPAIETFLGIALIVGLLTIPVAIASVGTLLLYWSADQLIAQYPIMLALSAVVLLFSRASREYAVDRYIWRGR